MSKSELKISSSDLERFQKETTEGYISSYSLSIDFKNDIECIGVVNISFDVFGYGIEGFEGGIDVSYQVMFFQDPTKEDELLDDDKAFIFIFTNYGEDIMYIVDTAWDVLDEHYENGTPITIFDS